MLYTIAFLNHIDRAASLLSMQQHCMRTQVMELCDLHKKILNNKLNFEYKAGSIDSLLRFVNANKASTLLPHLSAIDLTEKEQNFVSNFEKPIPFRSVGIVVHQHFVKFNVLNNLKNEILQSVIPLLPEQDFKGEQLSPV